MTAEAFDNQTGATLGANRCPISTPGTPNDARGRRLHRDPRRRHFLHSRVSRHGSDGHCAGEHLLRRGSFGFRVRRQWERLFRPRFQSDDGGRYLHRLRPSCRRWRASTSGRYSAPLEPGPVRCNWPAPLSVRLTTHLFLTSGSSWAVRSPARFRAAPRPVPTFTAPLAGTYTIQLSACDSTGRCATPSSGPVGAVSTDSKAVVVTGLSPVMDNLLGPLLISNAMANPWPYGDLAEIGAGSNIATTALSSTPQLAAPLPGTVSWIPGQCDHHHGGPAGPVDRARQHGDRLGQRRWRRDGARHMSGLERVRHTGDVFGERLRAGRKRKDGLSHAWTGFERTRRSWHG